MASEQRQLAQASNSGQQRSGLSLYANLLNSNSSNAPDGQTITRAPVVFKQQSLEEAQKEEDLAKRNAALRFQPTKRPQQATQKPKLKSAISKPLSNVQNTSSPDRFTEAAVASPAPPPPAKTTLADWAADNDDYEGFYQGEKRQRGGRKKRKKNKEETAAVQDWDDIYDPSRPNNYEHYKHSEERFREIRDWKEKLYSYRMKRRGSSEESDERVKPNSKYGSATEEFALTRRQETFAPPSNYSFAPPPTFNEDEGESPAQVTTEETPPPPPKGNINNDATGEDAYARRMRMSGIILEPSPAFTSTPPPPPSPPPPPPPDEDNSSSKQPVPPPDATISRAPVRYNFPAADASLPKTDEELEAALADADAQEEQDAADGSASSHPDSAPRSNRPGQKGFAERLMSKYGWSKGSGLGAAGTGIVNPLRVQVEKRKKKSDAEGGGWVGPSSKGKIIGSKYGKAMGGEEKKDEDAEVGLSEVVILKGMVDGLDLDSEMRDGNLMQEIGEECGEKYGVVERVFINRDSSEPSTPVFIKFTSQLSALRAVQALEGRIFNGNTIKAKFFDTEKFDAGQYE